MFWNSLAAVRSVGASLSAIDYGGEVLACGTAYGFQLR